MEGPRIYNLFPLLAGPVGKWRGHLDRIARMGFNWVYLNPIQYPGFSGSLYAIKDPYAYHPVLTDGLAPSPPPPDGPLPRSRAGDGGMSAAFERELRAFLAEAELRGLRVMLDLVVNHTSKDAHLTEDHPEWYQREPDGRIKSPFAIDPADARKVTVWGDLAELDYNHPESREGLLPYWARFVEHCLDLGFSGFRCDAAYKIPADAWRALIGAARRVRADTLFCAETLGCRLEEVAAVASAGFDFLFNSSKWWDFRAPWCLEQYEAHRHIAPSISFPESHDTPRLAAEVEGRLELLEQRYLFAAFFSAGVMMPIGFEYGARKPLNVIHTRFSDREPVLCDLTDFIGAANRMKAALPGLNEESPIRPLGWVGPVVQFLKSPTDGTTPILAWVHTKGDAAVVPVEKAEQALVTARDRIRVVSPPPAAVRTTGSSAPEAHRLGAPMAPFEVRILTRS